MNNLSWMWTFQEFGAPVLGSLLLSQNGIAHVTGVSWSLTRFGFAGCGHCLKILSSVSFLNTVYGSPGVRLAVWKTSSWLGNLPIGFWWDVLHPGSLQRLVLGWKMWGLYFLVWFYISSLTTWMKLWLYSYNLCVHMQIRIVLYSSYWLKLTSQSKA